MRPLARASTAKRRQTTDVKGTQPCHPPLATVGNTSNMTASTSRFLDLPAELRLKIVTYVISTITISIERGRLDQSRLDFRDDVEEEDDNHDNIEEAVWGQFRAISPLPVSVPAELQRLRLVCRRFAHDVPINQRFWHPHVTYRFPSTVAFVDVLSQWPESLVTSLRHAHVNNTPLPISTLDHSHYKTHDLAEALRLFPGLRLDHLVAENIWLRPNGDEAEPGWHWSATVHDLTRLSQSCGWRKLSHVSGILCLYPREARELVADLERLRHDRHEPDMTWRLGPNRPQVRPDASETDIAEVRQWYKDHSDEPGLGRYLEAADKQVTFSMRRSTHADYTQTGADLDPELRKLMASVSWAELRETDVYLVDDGIDDPEAHL